MERAAGRESSHYETCERRTQRASDSRVGYNAKTASEDAVASDLFGLGSKLGAAYLATPAAAGTASYGAGGAVPFFAQNASADAMAAYLGYGAAGAGAAAAGGAAAGGGIAEGVAAAAAVMT